MPRFTPEGRTEFFNMQKEALANDNMGLISQWLVANEGIAPKWARDLADRTLDSLGNYLSSQRQEVQIRVGIGEAGPNSEGHTYDRFRTIKVLIDPNEDFDSIKADVAAVLSAWGTEYEEDSDSIVDIVNWDWS